MSARRAMPLVSILCAASLSLGCARDNSVFYAAGPASRSIGALGSAVLGALCAIAALVLVVLVVAAVRRRGTFDTHAEIESGGGHAWIWLGGFALPVVVLSLIFAGALRTENAFPLHDGGHYRPDVRVIGRQWWWEVQYLGSKPDARVVTANEVHVPVGWPVEVELESRDVIHSFWVPALHGKVDLVPGRTNHIRILADVPGRFPGFCAEFCGPQHASMRFVIVAEPLPDYEEWLQHEGAPAVASLDAEAAEGQALFMSGACSLCHTIRGTDARGTVGPDLSHVARRHGIAGDSLPNTRAYVQAWITHAQSLKPHSQMPDLTMFRGPELQALAHYMEELK